MVITLLIYFNLSLYLYRFQNHFLITSQIFIFDFRPLFSLYQGARCFILLMISVSVYHSSSKFFYSSCLTICSLISQQCFSIFIPFLIKCSLKIIIFLNLSMKKILIPLELHVHNQTQLNFGTYLQFRKEDFYPIKIYIAP